MPDLFVNWHNPHEACQELRRLDKTFSTSTASPLHHDNRCKMNHSDILFEIQELLEPIGW